MAPTLALMVLSGETDIHNRCHGSFLLCPGMDDTESLIKILDAKSLVKTTYKEESQVSLSLYLKRCGCYKVWSNGGTRSGWIRSEKASGEGGIGNRVLEHLAKFFGKDQSTNFYKNFTPRHLVFYSGLTFEKRNVGNIEGTFDFSSVPERYRTDQGDKITLLCYLFESISGFAMNPENIISENPGFEKFLAHALKL